jgi:hypothetical protein
MEANPVYIDCSFAGAAARGGVSADGTSYFCPIDGGLAIEAGQTITASKVYLHVPGSDQAAAGSIVVPRRLESWLSYCPYFTLATTQNQSVKLGIMDTDQIGGGVSGFGDKLGFIDAMNNPILFQCKLVVEPGTYTPQDLAARLTAQTRDFYNVNQAPRPHIFDDIEPHAQACVPIQAIAFYTNGSTFNAIRLNDLRNPSQNTYCMPFKTETSNSQDFALPCGSTSGIVIAYDSGRQRFCVTTMHSPLYNTQGVQIAYRLNFTQNGNQWSTQIVADSGGCAVPTGPPPPPPPGSPAGVNHWHTNSPSWVDSVWNLLGFQPADLDRGDYGPFTTTTAVVTASMLFGGAQLNVELQNSATYLLDATATTTAIYASSGPQNTSTSYWLLEADLLPTTWRKGDGGRAPQTLASVDRSYPSGDVYVANGPPHVNTQARTIGGVNISFVDPSTGQRIVPGPKTAVQLTIQ